MLDELKKDLQEAGNPEKAKIFQKFFKTGKGEYGEGAIFLGINLPVQKEIAKKYDLDLDEIQELLCLGPVNPRCMDELQCFVA